jgi:hypothetical protein
MKTLISLLFLTLVVTSFKKADDWYLLQTHSYKILFPKKPTASNQEIDSQIGKLTLHLNIYEVPESESDDNHAYLTNETSYPDSSINSDNTKLVSTIFANAIAGAVKNVSGKLLSEKVIAFGKYPGREVRIDFQNGVAVIKMRIYLVRNSTIMIETITDTDKQYNKSIDKFMDSFRLIN